MPRNALAGSTHSEIPGLFALIRARLGASDIRSDADLARLVQQQLPVKSIQALVRGGLTDAEAHQLIVPRRTLAHRVAKKQRLSVDESDKAVRVARITAMAERTFGEPERAWRWLRKPKERFSGKAPIEMVGSEAGARLVEETIAQIDSGIFA
jgi:putative toxin-antitoxin system antitoxin component (TIGR02293 family)